MTNNFYIGQRWCSHDDGKTFHRQGWRCVWRWTMRSLLRGWLDRGRPQTYVSHVDEENGIITISTRSAPDAE